MSPPEYMPPGENDVRSPCPAINALANHGILPRSGKDFTMSRLIDALRKGFNLGTALATWLAFWAFLFYGKFFRTMSLSDLHVHGILEHDASLSRQDDAIGDHIKVDKDLVDLILSQKIDGKINTESLAKLSKIRQADSKERNKDFNFGWKQKTLAFGEYSLFLHTIGGATNKEVDAKVVEILFKEERIPDDWKMPETPVELFKVLRYQKDIEKKYEELNHE
ncbi:9818_t:CDS:2 [Funneliformis geosporum]|uniref:18895_t:CDS:1 n=1 Tax=Funneliformis geosporum TaxID=1117311 RepID=A0A9W4SRD8_9GLOM|nr:18895_t:CDS:2 [Funneliformis geosporum]CAI2178916.1 9818_t:CDS:2 [Funneliformis geosporum]